MIHRIFHHNLTASNTIIKLLFLKLILSNQIALLQDHKFLYGYCSNYGLLKQLQNLLILRAILSGETYDLHVASYSREDEEDFPG